MTVTMKPSCKSRHWSETILQAQKALLNLHATNFKWRQCPISLPNHHVINIVIAEPIHINNPLHPLHPPPPQSVLMLLHGWGAGLAYFARTLNHLVPHFRAVYLIDLPGMAASSRAPFPTENAQDSLDYFLHDLVDMHAYLHQYDSVFANASERHLVAHSLGAYIAAEWVIRQPTCFTSLSLVSPVGIPKCAREGEEVPSRMRAIKLKLAFFFWKRGYTPQDALRLRLLPSPIGKRLCLTYVNARYKPVEGWLPASAYKQARKDESNLMAEYCYANSIAPPASERAVSSLLKPGAWAILPLHDRLCKVQIPCLFVYGDRDWMDWRYAEVARRSMKAGSKLVRVKDADHNVFIDNCQGFAAEIISMIDDVANARF